MTIHVRGDDFGLKLCEIFGISPARVRAVTLNVHADEIVTLDIERVVTDVEAKELGTLLEKYEMVKQPEEKP